MALALGLGLVLILAAPVVPFAASRIEGAPLPASAPWILTAAVLCFALGTLSLCVPDTRVRLAGPGAGALLAALLALGGARVAEAWVSARPIGRVILAEMAPGDRIISYGTFVHGLGFYTKRPVDAVNWVGELYYAKRDPANQRRFGDDNTIRGLPEPGRSTFVVLRRKEAAWLTSLTSPEKLGEMRTFGPWALARFREGTAARKPEGRKSSPPSAPDREPSR